MRRQLWRNSRCSVARIYEVFPLTCPGCGADMRILAFIAAAEPALNTTRLTGRRYRAHLGPRSVAETRTQFGTNEAEFFAVATEAFFEKPTLLKTRYPELYEELARYFGQDTAANAAIPVRK